VQPPHVSRSHLNVKHSRCTYSNPYNQPIISRLVIHHSFSSSFHSIQKKLHLLYPPVLSRPYAPDHSLPLNDLATKILQISSSKCSSISFTSYPKISARRVPMQLEYHSLWLLLGVYTYPVYMILLCYEISLMHQPLHIMCLVCVQDHSPRSITPPPGTWLVCDMPLHDLVMF
jgi:hypothetical protein